MVKYVSVLTHRKAPQLETSNTKELMEPYTCSRSARKGWRLREILGGNCIILEHLAEFRVDDTVGASVVVNVIWR